MDPRVKGLTFGVDAREGGREPGRDPGRDAPDETGGGLAILFRIREPGGADIGRVEMFRAGSAFPLT